MHWNHFFPFPSYRQYQEETLCRIAEAHDKHKFVILQGKCGSGKSALAIAQAKYRQSAYIATVQKQLQDQIHRDFGEHLALLKGKSNYACTKTFERGQYTCGNAPCGLNVSSAPAKKISEECKSDGGCPYLGARDLAASTPITLLNFSNLLAFSALPQSPLAARKLLIADEAHRLEDELYKFAETSLTPASFEIFWGILSPPIQNIISRGFNSVKDVIAFVTDFIPKANNYLLRSLPLADEKQQLELAEGEKFVTKLTFFLEDYHSGRSEYIIKPQKEGCSIAPLKVSHLNELAFKLGEKVLLMSGTILDAEIFADNLGITDFEYINVPSTFPDKNNVIIFYPIGSMSYKNIDQTFPKMIKAIKLICEMHKGQKGLIQTYNYNIAERIAKSIDDPRFLIHTRIANKAELLRQHFESDEPTILVGPSFKEGLDFIGDYCNFQIHLKMPCADLKDPIISARKDLDQSWYDLKTAMDLIQALGRPIRSETCKATQYILDSYFGFFHSNNKKFFKDIPIQFPE